MDFTTICIALAVFAFAGLAKGVTGLGFSTVSLPLLTLAIGIKETLPLLILPSLASNFAVMIGAGGIGDALRRFRPLYVAALAGVIVGVALLGQMDAAGPSAVLGASLIAFASFSYARPNWRLPRRLERPLAAPTGLATGIVNGLTGSQVMPITPYLLSLGLSRDEMVTAVNISFTLSSLVMLAGLAQIGLATGATMAIAAVGVPVAFAAVWAGGRLRGRLPETAFRRGVLLMLALAGASLVARAL